MTKTLPYLCACVALATASATHAGSESKLVISGQLTPPACSMGVGGSSLVDFGTMPFHSLDRNGTLLKEQNPKLVITCGGPTRVAFSVQENRPDTAIAHQDAVAHGMPWPYQHPSNGAPHAWGLGHVDGTKIGALVLLLRPEATVIDGTPPFLQTSMILARPRGSAAWPIKSRMESINVNPTKEYSFGTDAGPVPITTASVSLAVTPMLNRTAVLPVSQEIPLDGSVTFTLQYL